MTYAPKSRFNPSDTPEELAQKLNDELQRISRTQTSGPITVIGGGGTQGAAAGGSTTIIQESSLARHFMLMGA